MIFTEEDKRNYDKATKFAVVYIIWLSVSILGYTLYTLY